MENVEDELDLRYHKGLNPDVYYRCPTLELLKGALRNEADKNASSFIPTHVVTEFIFATASTITIPVAQQANLDVLIEPANHLQSIAVEYALCRDIDGRERMKVQRAVARSIIEAIQETDGFEYSKRSARNKGGDGARLKYFCQDSVQKRNRKSGLKKDTSHDSYGSEIDATKQGPAVLPTYDCGGAIHTKFSLKREAINIVYKHNPIHTARRAADSPPVLVADNHLASLAAPADEKQPRKRKRSNKAETEVDNECRDPNLDMSTSPELVGSSARKRKTKRTVESSKSGHKTPTKQNRKAKTLASPSRALEKAPVTVESESPMPLKGKACIRCREKKIKCNKAKPTCNQYLRGLWACQYEIVGNKKRSKNGCLNCKRRKRKCTEERPSCTHCLRLDDDCEYVDYS